MQRTDPSHDRGKEGAQRRRMLVQAGSAFGIGSAAIAAALLYASKIKLGRQKPRADLPG
jgi:hypothetical protein